jgi:hypothetical protein
MFKEATVFAQHLRIVEKELNQWQRDIECEQWQNKAAIIINNWLKQRLMRSRGLPCGSGIHAPTVLLYCTCSSTAALLPLST